jgi:hypothetical protein
VDPGSFVELAWVVDATERKVAALRVYEDGQEALEAAGLSE